MRKVKLRDLGDIITGNTPSKKEAGYWNSNDIPFIKPDIISDAGITILCKADEHLSEQARSKARIVNKDAVLVTCIGSIGKVGIASDGEYAFNQQINAIVPNNGIYPKYLAYAILQAKPRLEAIANAPVVPIINKSQFGEFPIYIENDLTQQRKIVEKLDKLNEIINSRKAELNKLDELIKARFVEMFGDPETNSFNWEEFSLAEKLDVLGGYAFKSEDFDEESGIPVLRIGNVNSGTFKPVNMVFWKEDSSLERYAIYPGDLVMSLTGTVGKNDYGNVCILGHDYEKYYLNQRNAKLEIKQGLEKLYLSQLLKFERIKKRLTGISRGVRQANISNKDILNLVVPIPPIEMQNQFADFVKQVDKSKSVIQKSSNETQLLFDSLMQDCFG